MNVAYTLFCLYKYRFFKFVRRLFNKPASYHIKNSIYETEKDFECLHRGTGFPPYTKGRVVIIKVDDKIGHIYTIYGVDIVRVSILYLSLIHILHHKKRRKT